jgi:hypothetical protein
VPTISAPYSYHARQSSKQRATLLPCAHSKLWAKTHLQEFAQPHQGFLKLEVFLLEGLLAFFERLRLETACSQPPSALGPGVLQETCRELACVHTFKANSAFCFPRASCTSNIWRLFSMSLVAGDTWSQSRQCNSASLVRERRAEAESASIVTTATANLKRSVDLTCAYGVVERAERTTNSRVLY